MTSANGHAPPALPALAPFTVPRSGPAAAWPQQDGHGQPRTIPDDPGRRRRAIDGDTAIRVLAAAVVLAVAAFAAIVSYSHIFELGRQHHQDGAAARLLPLSVDGLIAAASLVMLHAARKRIAVPFLARAMLALGVGATVAANVGYGLPFGWLAAVVSAWPAAAFVGSVEMAVRFVIDARTAAAPATGDATPAATCDGTPRDIQSGTRPAAATAEPARQPRHGARSGSDRVRDILARDPGLPPPDVAAETGMSVRQVQRVKREMNGAAK